MNKAAVKLADDILYELGKRKGWDYFWGDIDEDIREEIRDKVALIASPLLDAPRIEQAQNRHLIQALSVLTDKADQASIFMTHGPGTLGTALTKAIADARAAIQATEARPSE